MGDFFTKLLGKLSAMLSWIGDLVGAALTSLLDVFKDASCWLFDSVLGVATSAINAIDVSAIAPYVSGGRSLPAEILNILALLGVAPAVTIITAALVIRMTLQLIPFIRLGS